MTQRRTTAMTQRIATRAMLAMTMAALVGFAPAAMAQPGGGPGGMMGGGGPGPGMMGGGGPGMMGGAWTSASYLDSLKSELAITAAEEPAWKDYAGTVAGVAEQMQGLHQTMFQSMGSASWQQRRDLMNTMFEARQQAVTTVHDAAEKLASALSPEQQAKAKDILPGLGYGPGMMGPGMMGPGMMQGRGPAAAPR
jgi:LTXXQ motif family protein